MVKIVRNVAGVPGLDLALDTFSDSIGATHFGKEHNGHVSGPQT